MNNLISGTLNCKKIWNSDVSFKDTYLDFKANFNYSNASKVELQISCDSIFSFYINGKLCGFGNCSNFKDRKLFYTFDITKDVLETNDLLISVWHQGKDSSTYIEQDAYLMFKIVSDGKTLLESDKNVLCRVNNSYKQGLLKIITKQLGLSYFYDFNASSFEFQNSIEYGFDKAICTGIKNLDIIGRNDFILTKVSDGYLIDLGREAVGFLDFDIESYKIQEVKISYGEHLVNGNVPQIVGERDFSFDFKLKKGRNSYINTFRRIACRYLHINSKELNINFLSVNMVEYPVKELVNKFKDDLIQKIYDVSVYTLKCCMHEHYEDCPWREQALYTQDSRNQMLCGYYAFKDYEFQRANLLLISHSVRENGLLPICAPCSDSLAIPFFSLFFPIQVYEYIKHSNDDSILEDVKDTLSKIMSAFEERVEENGLIADFPYPYWNFYEWSEESSNEDQILRNKNSECKKIYSSILNSMYIYAHRYYDNLFHKTTNLDKTIEAIKKAFYDEKTGLFLLNTETDKSSVLSNSLAILIGLGDKELIEKIKMGNDLIPITLSSASFFYDALLQFDSSNATWIIEDIKEKYSRMLDKGATTFWETEKGYEDFDMAGSLCHGWSALPVYYFSKLLNE